MTSRVKNELVGAFSTSRGLGNPVYVVYDYGTWTPEYRQLITSTVNLSECVFINSITPSNGQRPAMVDVSIYNPNNAMRFAGHPLIGTIGSLRNTLGIEKGIIDTGHFQSAFHSHKTDGGVKSYLGVQEPYGEIYDSSIQLCKALSIPECLLPIYDCGPRHVLIKADSIKSLREFDPKWERLKMFKDIALNVFFSESGYVENRMFSPSYGVYEDRATGTAVIPILKELRKVNPSMDYIEIAQGVNKGAGVLMQGAFQRDTSSYVLSGLTTIIAEGEFIP